MTEKLLVTQALDERDLLVKKINDKIAKATFVDAMRNNEETVTKARVDKETFGRQVESAYQQICDLITRFRERLCFVSWIPRSKCPMQQLT